jgi:hypothetical protein
MHLCPYYNCPRVNKRLNIGKKYEKMIIYKGVLILNLKNNALRERRGL